MNIAIISDTHNNIPNIKIVLDYIKKHKVGMLIHCGDVTTVETVEYIANQCNMPFRFCLGNADITPYDMIECANLLDEVTCVGDSGEIIVDNVRLFITHYPQEAMRVSYEKKDYYTHLFYGHTHKPWIEESESAYIINPGALAGMIYESSFCMLDSISGYVELVTAEKLLKI
jgi:putative phosphoesterase